MNKRKLAAIAVAWMLAGCVQTGTDTGNPAANTRACASDPAMQDATFEELASDDTMTPLGFSAADVLDDLLGKHTLAFAWQDWREHRAPTPDELDTIEVTVTRLDTPARFVDYASKYDGLSYDRLEFDVRVKISIGKLARPSSFDAVVRANGRGFVTLGDRCTLDAADANLSASDIMGIEQLDPRWTELSDVRALFYLGFAEGRVSGHLFVYGKSAAQPKRLSLSGRFPADNPCGPVDVPLRTHERSLGVSMDEALEWSATAEPRALTWQEGTTTSLSLAVESVEPWVCVDSEGIDAWGTVDARTEDGRLSFVESARLHVWLNFDGSLKRVDTDVEIGTPSEPLSESELGARTGLEGIEVTDQDDGLWFELHDYVESDHGTPHTTGWARASSGYLVPCACVIDGVPCTIDDCAEPAPTSQLDAVWGQPFPSSE